MKYAKNNMPSNDRSIIAFAGRLACGKGIAGRLLIEEFGAQEINYSDMLHDSLRIMGIDETQDHIEQLSVFLRTAFGSHTFEQGVFKKILSIENRIMVLGGIRRESDFSHIREQYPFSLIYIDSLLKERYARYTKRGRGKGDCDLSLEEFRDKDTKEPELEIEKLKELSDAIIENNGTLEEFKNTLRATVKRFLI